MIKLKREKNSGRVSYGERWGGGRGREGLAKNYDRKISRYQGNGVVRKPGFKSHVNIRVSDK